MMKLVIGRNEAIDTDYFWNIWCQMTAAETEQSWMVSVGTRFENYCVDDVGEVANDVFFVEPSW